jgi:LPS export ABC transporter permease LptF/LPS export ABC transporter permease LptG
MRKIDKLVFQAVIPPLLISLVVLTFVFFTDKLGSFSELLITQNASPETILLIAAAIAPSIMIFSLPLSFLIGILIGLSGLSGESQITALRACGVPLRRILRPILAIAGFVGVLTMIMSVYVLPRTNDILASLKDLINLRQATSQIMPRVFNEQFANVVFYLDDISLDRQHWERVFLADNSDPKAPRIVMAREGSWVTDRKGTRLQLHLEQGTIYEVNQQDPSKDNISHFEATDIPIDLNQGKGGSDIAGGESKKKPAEQPTMNLWHGSPGTDPEERRMELIEFHKRLALPCSVLGFAFLGLALGVSARRGSRTSGSVLGLIFVIVFYVLFGNGLRLATVGKLPPWLGAWGADIILIALGTAMVASAEQDSWLTRWLTTWHWKSRMESFVHRFHLGTLRTALQKLDDLAIASTSSIARVGYPKVLDSYISRGFLVYFFWATTVCFSLFVVLTLFDLLDEIIRNRISAILVAKYLVFLTPHIMLLVVPMSVLLAVLIQFGILEKGSEVTAMKAGGWSLYRIALPAFLLASLLSAGMYFMQDYILPYANIRQDEMRNLIKGRPARTFSRPRKWIFGERDRIFNYDWFVSNQDLFYGLNVYEVDLTTLVIRRRIYALQATVDRTGTWILDNGWIRDFTPGREGFERITKKTLAYPEPASYFKKEIFEPGEASKLTYVALKEYINYLRQSGYNATELQVALYKKISFPLGCFLMALLGLPFSFSMGKRGAFFGITSAVAIAMSYWGVSSVFEQMGAYGMLSPILSAWAPNILFGSTGLALLFTIRT